MFVDRNKHSALMCKDCLEKVFIAVEVIRNVRGNEKFHFSKLRSDPNKFESNVESNGREESDEMTIKIEADEYQMQENVTDQLAADESMQNFLRIYDEEMGEANGGVEANQENMGENKLMKVMGEDDSEKETEPDPSKGQQTKSKGFAGSSKLPAKKLAAPKKKTTSRRRGVAKSPIKKMKKAGGTRPNSGRLPNAAFRKIEVLVRNGEPLDNFLSLPGTATFGAVKQQIEERSGKKVNKWWLVRPRRYFDLPIQGGTLYKPLSIHAVTNVIKFDVKFEE
jgi:hypothetical protein